MWVVIAMAEVTAAGIYMQYWFPGLPQWVPALVALVGLLGVNLIAVGIFGEFEFWFAIIKVVTIIGMIVLGLGDPGARHQRPRAHSVVLAPVVSRRLLPEGIQGAVPGLAGSDVRLPRRRADRGHGRRGPEAREDDPLGDQQGDLADPDLLHRRARHHHVARRLEPPEPDQSPFVMVFSKVGIPTAAGIINFVVLTAALSSCNSGIFSTGRMLYTLAGYRQAPAGLRKLSRNKVPATGMMVSFVAMLVGVLLNYFIPASAFAYITSVATGCGLFVWAMVMVAHMRYRKLVKAGPAARGRLPDAALADRRLVRARPSSAW